MWVWAMLACTAGAPPPEPAITELGAPPSAAAAALVKGDRAPLDVTFDGGGSSDPDGDLDTLVWDFGDGSPAGTGPKVPHRYEKPGRYVVKLVATDKAGNTDETVIAVDVLPAECPVAFGTVAAGTVDDPDLKEISGLALSRRGEALWVHNDSGDTGRIFAIGLDGRKLSTWTLGVEATDWEDIAVGPGPDAAKSYVYVADIGDNKEKRDSVVIWRVEEPDPKGKGGTLTPARLQVKYPDGPHNAETLLSDPKSGDLYIVGKRDDGVSGLWRLPAPHVEDELRTAEKVGELVFGSEKLPGSPKVTGGDVSQDGSRIVLRTYDDAYIWIRNGEEPLQDALSRMPCTAMVADEPQGEAIAFSADAKAYFTTSEELKQPLWRFDLK
jgi:PKD repeat protein